MKTIAYTALLYGKDYLASAIRSVIDAVDEYHVLYTPVGSHGHRTDVPCPETREELYEIARQAAGNKFHWHESQWAYEGAQRDSIMQYAPDADVILVVDADEIWTDRLAHNLISDCKVHVNNNNMKRMRIPIIHYWRSFYRCVLHDPAYPERIIFPKAEGEHVGTASIPFGNGIYYGIHHMGYAQRPEIVEYKQLTHGHKSEWRKDVDWFADKFMANAQQDTHPVGSEFWNPEQVDPFALGLPEWMREHAYAGMSVIE